MEADHFYFPELCDKCKRYYNPRTPHVCVLDDSTPEEWRRKLKKWLGRGTEVIEPKV